MKAALLVVASAGLSECVDDIGLGFTRGKAITKLAARVTRMAVMEHILSAMMVGLSVTLVSSVVGTTIAIPTTVPCYLTMKAAGIQGASNITATWGERRHKWYRKNHDRDLDPNRNEGHMRDRCGYRSDGRHDGRRHCNAPWRGGGGFGVGAMPAPE